MKLSQVPIKKLQLIYKSAKLLNNKLLKNYLQNIQRKASWMKDHKNRKNGPKQKPFNSEFRRFKKRRLVINLYSDNRK